MSKIKNNIRCGRCEALAYYEPFFKEYQCKKCGWSGKEPVASYIREVIKDTGVTKQELFQLVDNVLKLSYLDDTYDTGELNEMKDYLEREMMSERDKKK